MLLISLCLGASKSSLLRTLRSTCQAYPTLLPMYPFPYPMPMAWTCQYVCALSIAAWLRTGLRLWLWLQGSGIRSFSLCIATLLSASLSSGGSNAIHCQSPTPNPICHSPSASGCDFSSPSRLQYLLLQIWINKMSRDAASAFFSPLPIHPSVVT